VRLTGTPIEPTPKAFTTDDKYNVGFIAAGRRPLQAIVGLAQGDYALRDKGNRAPLKRKQQAGFSRF